MIAASNDNWSSTLACAYWTASDSAAVGGHDGQAQRGLVFTDLSSRGSAENRQSCHCCCPRFLDPSFGVIHRRSKHLGEFAPFGVGDLRGRRPIGVPCDMSSRHPQCAAHRMEAQQRSVVVEGALDGLDRRVDHPCADRQEHRGGVGRMQAHQRVGDRRDVVGSLRREQPVASGQAVAPFRLRHFPTRSHVRPTVSCPTPTRPRRTSRRAGFAP